MRYFLPSTNYHLHRVLLAGIVTLMVSAVVLFLATEHVEAAINQQINYQAKLTDSSGFIVTDGSYNMEFKLYTVASGGSAIWTETRTGANKVTVTSGLFSVLLGSVTSLSGIDLNQTALYLGVNVGGTGSPSWDGEMTPRKRLGAFPAAFEAGSLAGYTWSEPGTIGSTTPNTGAFTTIGVGLASPNTSLEVSAASPEFRITNSTTAAYLRLVKDTAANDNRAILYDRIGLQDGTASGGLSFDGSSTNSYVQMANSLSVTQATSLSLSAWIKLPTDSSGGGILAQGVSDQNGYYALDVTGSGVIRGIAQSTTTQNSSYYYTGTGPIVSPLTYRDNTWHHVAFVIDSTKGALYIDGARVALTERNGTNTLTTTATGAYDIFRVGAVGHSVLGSWAYFDGTIDEARVYSRSLTPADITDQYNAGTGQRGQAETGLRGGWHLDEATGTTTADYSGNSNTGTLSTNSGALPTWATGKAPVSGTLTEIQVWSSEDGGSGSEQGIQTFGDASSRTVMGGTTLRGFIGGTERLRIQSDGRVGIGTTSPSVALHVENGSITNISRSGTNPTLSGSVTTAATPQAVAVVGTYAYIVDNTAAKLEIIDMSNPASLVLVSSTAVGSAPSDIVVAGRYAYIADPTSNTVYIYDISNASAPSSVGSIVGGGSGIKQILVSGRYAYTIEGSSTLRSFNVSDPAVPVVADTVTLNGTPDSFTQSGRYLYAVSGGVFEVIDASDPTNLSIAGSASLISGTAKDMAAEGRYVYVTDSTGNLIRAIDVENATTPVAAGSVAASTDPVALTVSGRYVVAAMGTSSLLEVFDVRTPASMSKVGSITTSSNATELALVGQTAVVITAAPSLRTYSIGGIEATSALIHAVSTGKLHVRNDMFVLGMASVRRGLNVGAGGIFSQGSIATAGSAYAGSGLSVATTSPNFTIDVAGNGQITSSNKLYFGGTSGADNDTELSRSAADTLSTPDTFKAGGYQSSDGTAGMTGTLTVRNSTNTAGCTLEVENGLVTTNNCS